MTQNQPRSAPADRRRSRVRRLPAMLATTGAIALLAAPAAMAHTGDSLKEGTRNGTATRETEIISKTPFVSKGNGGYATRQSNLSSTGGGAIYGCRAASETKTLLTNPCVRANNLSTGKAFEFQTHGPVAGTIQAVGGDNAKPFTTNATGVATGLNADRVDGMNAEDIIKKAQAGAPGAPGAPGANAAPVRWLLLNEKGEIEGQSGGFKVLDAYGTDDPNDVYIDAGAALDKKGLTGTIAAQNQIDLSAPADGTADPNFGGEISVATCGNAAVLKCAPADAQNANAFVVAPRNSDGSTTSATSRKRVYVTVTS